MRIRSRTMLADYIKLLGLSERSFARQCQLSHSTINHLITGRRQTCSAATAEVIEANLGCPPGLIFRADGPG
jgi:plasmid maintenance system antidote protein VapI